MAKLTYHLGWTCYHRYSVNECPASLIMLSSIHLLVCTLSYSSSKQTGRNRLLWASSEPRRLGRQPGGGGPVSRTRGARRGDWVPKSWTSLVCERQAPEHPKSPFTFESLFEYVISIDAFKYRSCDETLAAFYSILVQISYHYLVIELGSSSSLAML